MNAQPLEIAQQLRLDAVQPRLCVAHTVRLDGERQVFRLAQAVVGGIPVSNDAAPGTPNALATINPNDIETFTVLKDASATAIDGSRASNGRCV